VLCGRIAPVSLLARVRRRNAQIARIVVTVVAQSETLTMRNGFLPPFSSSLCFGSRGSKRLLVRPWGALLPRHAPRARSGTGVIRPSIGAENSIRNPCTATNRGQVPAAASTPLATPFLCSLDISPDLACKLVRGAHTLSIEEAKEGSGKTMSKYRGEGFQLVDSETGDPLTLTDIPRRLLVAVHSNLAQCALNLVTERKSRRVRLFIARSATARKTLSSNRCTRRHTSTAPRV
jgi:hypothetical protein